MASRCTAIAQRIPFQRDGLILLGTEACGDVSVPLYVDRHHVPQHTLRRKQKVVRLADAALEMVRLAPPSSAKQAAFSIGRCIIAHALDYDAGVLPCSSLLPHARELDQHVLRVTSATFDMTPDELSKENVLQMSLPVNYAGLQIDMPSRIAPLARVARLVEMGPLLRAAIAAWDRSPDLPEVDPRRYDGVDEEIEGGIDNMLRERGIASVGACGRPTALPSSGAADPFRPAMPERHLLSKYLQHSASVCFLEMVDRAPVRDRARLWSASGPTAGKCIVSDLNIPGVALSDRQWTEALRWRLGISSLSAPDAQCKNAKSKDNELCGAAMDACSDHAMLCKCGPFVNFRHDDIAEVYTEIFEEAGAYARREVFVPEWSTGSTEAWLDVWAYGIPEIPDCLLDVTVRHPFASRYMPAASEAAGSAARSAEQEKRDRYPASGGRRVWPAAHESWGRLGEDAEALLALCAAAMARREHRRGRLPGNCIRRWRAQLDAAMMRGVAAQLVSARFGAPGRSRRRLPPSDQTGLEARCPLG